jgi:predicted DNA-binding transcriptional regulator AlpA
LLVDRIGNEVYSSHYAERKAYRIILVCGTVALLTVDDVAQRLNVTKDWVWDHSSRKAPYLPVIRMSDGVLRYRASEVDEFVNERERLSAMRRKRR